MNVKLVVSVLIILVALTTNVPTYAQEVRRENAIAVECGTILEGEFTHNLNEHNYALNIEPGTSLQISAVPLGSGLQTGVFITGPTNLVTWISEGRANDSSVDRLDTQNEPSINTDPLGTRGFHTIRVVNFSFQDYDALSNEYSNSWIKHPSGVGVYTLLIGCTLRDGRVIQPGSISEPATLPTETIGFGFPGIDPVDFSGVAPIRRSIQDGFTSNGVITLSGGEIIGYVFEANEGDTVALDFTRESGNLNLGLIVIDADSRVIFQTSMVTGNTLSTTFTIPFSGEYTAGIFRIDLLPPNIPEATAFEISAVLNP